MTAQRCLDAAVDALQPAASSVNCGARITGAAVFEGCVHVLLEVELLPDALGQAPGLADLDGLAAGYQAALQQQLGQDAQLVLGPGHNAMAAVAPATPWEDTGAGFSTQQLPWAALATPVCLAAKARGAHSVRVALLASSPAELPPAPRLVVTGHCLAADGSVESSCDVLGSQQLWSVPAAAGLGRKLLSISNLATGPAPGVLTLHLLPDAAPAAGAQQAAVHPLASLPLLHLPAAASEEVLKLFAGMVGQVLEQHSSGGTAADEPSAARQAYWNHYVPFVHSWRSLLLAVDARAKATAAAQGILHTAEGQTSTYTAAPAAFVPDDSPASSQAAGKEDNMAGISSVLTFLADVGMVECLTLALLLVQQAGLPLEDLLPLDLAADSDGSPAPEAQQEEQQEHQPAGAAAAAAEISGPGSATGSDDRAGNKPEPQPIGSSKSRASGTSSIQAISSKAGSSLSSHAMDKPLEWRDALLGFPDAASEAAYVLYRNSSRSATNMDLLAGSVCTLLWVLQLTMFDLSWSRHAVLLHAALLLPLLPLLPHLLHRRWYVQHREGMLGACAGAARILMACTLSLRAYKSADLWWLHRCVLLTATVPCLLSRPVTQQVMSRASKLVLLLELMGVLCFAAAADASWQALLLGAVLNLALKLFFDYGKRRAFLGMQGSKLKAE
jgi:hypothetical protein